MVACLKAKLTGIRLVRMIHGGLSPVYLTQQGKWRKRLVGPLERLCFAMADRVVTTGAWEVGWARAWGLKRDLEVIDLKSFFSFDLTAVAAKREALRRQMKAGGSLKLLYLGRQHPLKGTEILRRAVAGGTAELREVGDHFGAALEKDWAWADALVLPTLSENFGLVVAEALTRGLPVITTDGAPAWEGQEGVIYVTGFREADPDRQVDLLKRAIASLGT